MFKVDLAVTKSMFSVMGMEEKINGAHTGSGLGEICDFFSE